MGGYENPAATNFQRLSDAQCRLPSVPCDLDRSRIPEVDVRVADPPHPQLACAAADVACAHITATCSSSSRLSAIELRQQHADRLASRSSSTSLTSSSSMAAKVPISPAAVGGIAQVLIGGGLAVYGLANSLFNVEGGHRAIVFNRLMGIKEEVRNVLQKFCLRG